MSNSITPYGKQWELRHSLWMLWLFFPFGFFSFISFFYIGARVRQKKWLISGFIYAIGIIIFFIVDEYYPIDHIAYDLTLIVVIALWIAAWVQAVSSRKEYLVLLVLKKRETDERYRALLNNEQPKKKTTRIKTIPKKKKSMTRNISERNSTQINQENSPTVVNINTASQEEIASIPGIGNLLAAQIVEVRKRIGSFQSFTHFVEEMNIKPHIVAKARQYMRFSNTEASNVSQNNQSAEQKDKYGAGRIVDY